MRSPPIRMPGGCWSSSWRSSRARRCASSSRRSFARKRRLTSQRRSLGAPRRSLRYRSPRGHGLREDRNAPHNLPAQVSSFVGRERELSELRQLLSRARVITLTGAGGVGKTRLALQLAASMLDESGDGAWFVDLAPLTDATLVAGEAGGRSWSPGAARTIAAAVADRRVQGPTVTRDPGQLRARDRRGGQCRRPVGARLSEDDHSRDQPRAARDRRRASISRPLAVRPAGQRRSRPPARVRRSSAVR